MIAASSYEQAQQMPTAERVARLSAEQLLRLSYWDSVLMLIDIRHGGEPPL